MGDWPGAIENYERALVVQRDLVASDKENAMARWRLANLLTDIGEARAETGRLNEALIYHKEAIALLELSSEGDEENVSLVTFLARSYQRYGDALLKAKQFETAMTFYEKALSNNREMADEDAENMDIRWALAEDYLKLGRANLKLYEVSPKQKHHLTMAREMFVRSKEVYQDMEAHRLKVKPVLESIEALTDQVNNCDQMLAKL
jgi:tetratricopeptide (TPR) repeat protein